MKELKKYKVTVNIEDFWFVHDIEAKDKKEAKRIAVQQSIISIKNRHPNKESFEAGDHTYLMSDIIHQIEAARKIEIEEL